jgi:hypothetical protein
MSRCWSRSPTAAASTQSPCSSGHQRALNGTPALTASAAHGGDRRARHSTRIERSRCKSRSSIPTSARPVDDYRLRPGCKRAERRAPSAIAADDPRERGRCVRGRLLPSGRAEARGRSRSPVGFFKGAVRRWPTSSAPGGRARDDDLLGVDALQIDAAPRGAMRKEMTDNNISSVSAGMPTPG